MKYLSIFISVALLALGQSLDCHRASEVSLMDMGKSVNVWPQQSTAKQKPCAYFLGYTVNWWQLNICKTALQRYHAKGTFDSLEPLLPPQLIWHQAMDGYSHLIVSVGWTYSIIAQFQLRFSWIRLDVQWHLIILFGYEIWKLIL